MFKTTSRFASLFESPSPLAESCGWQARVVWWLSAFLQVVSFKLSSISNRNARKLGKVPSTNATHPAVIQVNSCEKIPQTHASEDSEWNTRRNNKVVLVMMQQHLRKSILEMNNFPNFKVPMNSVVAERDDASTEVIAAPHNGFVEISKSSTSRLRVQL